MILYHPTDGEVFTKRIQPRPRTCFIMTKLGNSIPKEIKKIKSNLKKYLNSMDIKVIDANSIITGRDFLVKIWEMLVSVPLGIAIITKNLSPITMANIFYEIGILQTLGKETLIVKSKDSKIPSDFVRTEYIEYKKYSRGFKRELNKYLKTFFKQANYYDTLGSELEKNPLIAIDYLKRAYLRDGNSDIKDKVDHKINNFFSPGSFDSGTQEIIKELLRLKP